MTTAPLAAHGPLRPPAVLVVNDRESSRLGVRVMLRPLGLEIVEADSGRAALAAVERQTFAVILMDVRMPIMDGYESAKLIRERNDAGLTPIIFFTAFGQDETETLTAYATGAVDFIFTPVLADVLRAKVLAFVALFVQARELQRSIESVTALNTALRESHVRERAVIENVADGIVTAGEDGRIESLNRSAQALFGYTEAEMVGEPLGRLLAEDDLARLIAAGRRTETWGCRKDGSCFPMEVAISRMEIGERTSIVGCLHDITRRREREELELEQRHALHRDAQRDRAAFDEAPIGSLITGRDGLIARVNRSLCAMTNCEPEDLLGTHFLSLTHPEDRDRCALIVAALVTEHTGTQRFEMRYVLPDDRVIEARVALTAIRDGAGQVSQIFAQLEDVTEAHRTSRELDQAQFEILARLAAAAEFRDDDTGQHTRRVGDLSVGIAQRLGLAPEQVELIRLAAPLHDVGKIAIPDAILGKPGKLTDDEFAEMKSHTTVGARMLAGSAFRLLEVAEQIALTHHEKWDGRGYPAGLAGGDIPLVGRIVAVADVFDALTHERPYKEAWTQEAAVAEMADQSGRHFDPDVLCAFFDLLDETGTSRVPVGAGSAHG